MCEQNHAEFKNSYGLNLERLPSHSFLQNELVMHMGMITFNIIRMIGVTCLEHAVLEKVANAAAGTGTCRATMTDEDQEFTRKMEKKARESASCPTFYSSEKICGDKYAGKVHLKRPIARLHIGTVIEKAIKIPGCMTYSGRVYRVSLSKDIPWSEALSACWGIYVLNPIPVKMEADPSKDPTKYEVPVKPNSGEEDSNKKRKKKGAASKGTSKLLDGGSVTVKTTTTARTVKTIKKEITYWEETVDGGKVKIKQTVITEITSKTTKLKGTITTGKRTTKRTISGKQKGVGGTYGGPQPPIIEDLTAEEIAEMLKLREEFEKAADPIYAQQSKPKKAA